MDFLEALESIDRFQYVEEGKKFIETLSILDFKMQDIKIPNREQIEMFIHKTSEIIAVFQQIDIVKASDAVINLPQNIQKAADIWADYGWVPYLPTSSINELIDFKYPKSQDEADRIMMQKLDDNGINLLFDRVTDKVKSHSHNINTFEEAVKSYKIELYSGCALLLLAIIDSCFIFGQPTPTSTKKNKKPKRQLAGQAVENAIADKAQIAIFAYTTKRVIDKIFKHGDDFKISNENGLNRNFLSHGMNTYIPVKKDCLQLFVLLYNIYVSFDGKFFCW